MLSKKLEYLLETKGLLREVLNQKGANITDSTPFREYSSQLASLSLGGQKFVNSAPVNVLISKSIWDGSRAQVEVVGYLPGEHGIQIGLPPKDTTVNMERVIKASLTIPSFYTTKPDQEELVSGKTGLYISSLEPPTEDIEIAIYGLELCETIPLTISEITGLSVPVTGEKPMTEIKNSQFNGTIVWSPADTTFAASTVYTATITLIPNPGYNFSKVTSNYFTVKGASSVSNSSGSGVVTAKFPATGAAQ